MASKSNCYMGPLADGMYFITSAHYSTSIVDLRGRGTNNGTNVVANRPHGGRSQQWIFESGTRGYKIMNAETGAYLSYDINQTPRYGLAVTAYHDNPVEWNVVKEGTGYQFRLASDDGMVLDLWAGNSKENAGICFCTRHNSVYCYWSCNPAPKSFMERKIEALAKSIDEFKDQLTTSMEDTRNRLAAVEASVARAQNDITVGQEGVAEIRNQLSATGRQSSPIKSPSSNEKIPQTSIGQLAGLAQRFPALEAKTDKLAVSFGQTRDYLVGVQGFLQTTKQELATLGRALPAVEAKTDQMAESFLQHQFKVAESLTATEDRLDKLDNRVTIVEGKTEELSVSWDQICGTHWAEDDSKTPDPELASGLGNVLFVPHGSPPLYQTDGLPRLPDTLD